MKKAIALLLCGVLFVGMCSLSASAQTTTSEEITESTTIITTSKKAETTEFVLEVDVNKRFTDFANEPEDVVSEKNTEKDGKNKAYIAVLCAALVVSVVILAVSLKRVPKEEDIDISGNGRAGKKKEE